MLSARVCSVVLPTHTFFDVWIRHANFCVVDQEKEEFATASENELSLWAVGGGSGMGWDGMGHPAWRNGGDSDVDWKSGLRRALVGATKRFEGTCTVSDMSMSNLARRRTLDAKYDILATLSAVAYTIVR